MRKKINRKVKKILEGKGAVFNTRLPAIKYVQKEKFLIYYYTVPDKITFDNGVLVILIPSIGKVFKVDYSSLCIFDNGDYSNLENFMDMSFRRCIFGSNNQSILDMLNSKDETTMSIAIKLLADMHLQNKKK